MGQSMPIAANQNGFEKLLTGFNGFAGEGYGPDGTMPGLVRDGQNPEFFVLGCQDSRGHPGLIFRPKPGLFMPFTPPGGFARPWQEDTTALNGALEIALNEFGVRKVLLVHHTSCGMMKILVNSTNNPRLATFAKVANLASERARQLLANDNIPGGPTPDMLLRKTTEQSLLLSYENLRGYPVVRELEKELQFKGWIFNMEEGILEDFNFATSESSPIILPSHMRDAVGPNGVNDKAGADPELLGVFTEQPGAHR